MHLGALLDSNCITFHKVLCFLTGLVTLKLLRLKNPSAPVSMWTLEKKARPMRPRKKSTLVALDQLVFAWDQSIFFWLHWQAGIQQCKAQVSQQQYLSKQLFERYLRDIGQLFEGHLRAIWEFSKIYIWELFERYLRASWKLFKKLIESYLQDTWEPFESF